MRTLSRIECFNVGCTNEASVTINGDHVCTQCARADLPDDLHKFLPVPGIPEDMQFLGGIPFPCKIKFIIVPYVGMPRSIVYECADQAQCDSYIDYFMSDATGNTRKVTHSVYVAPPNHVSKGNTMPQTSELYECTVNPNDKLIAYITEAEHPPFGDFALVMTNVHEQKISVLLNRDGAIRLQNQMNTFIIRSTKQGA